MTTRKKDLSRNYDRAAWYYEKSAKFYSTNQISASKKFQLRYIEPGSQVLYLGAGTGEDAVRAARQGAQVTCIDISSQMLDRVQRRFDKENLTVELVCVDAFQFDRAGRFDVVAANYFLNVFRKEAMVRMLSHTATLVKPGGRYLIADVSLPQGNLVAKAFNLVYLKMAMGVFWAMGLVPWHENYDYPAHFPESGLELEHVEYFRFLKRGPVVFQSIVARRTA